MTLDLNEWANPHVLAMAAYTPGLQPSESGWVKLNTNELPYPPSPQVVEAIQAQLGDGGSVLRLYPNPTSAQLREAVADYHGLSPDQVIVGNGADDLLNVLCRTFSSAEKSIGMTVPSYSLYATLGAAQGAPIQSVSFDRSMELPAESIKACSANLFLLTSPNAPTGQAFRNDLIRKTVSGFRGLFVLDETYAPFAHENAIGLLAELPNLIIVRSFSKAFALAGLRIGYALASRSIIQLLDRVRDSYNLDSLAQVAALAAIQDPFYYAGVIDRVREERERMESWYRGLGWFFYPSAANFHFIEPVDAHGETGAVVSESLFNALHRQKILVRRFPRHSLTQSFLRISLGSESEMEHLKCAITSWVKKS